MRNHNKTWTDQEIRTMSIMAKQGVSPEKIARDLGRTSGAVVWKMYDTKIRTPKQPRPSAKYTRYMKPKSEFSLLWGLFKWTKA